MNRIFLAGLYEDFKNKAHDKQQVFTVSRGRFVRDLGIMLDLKLAHQNNGRPREPLIKVVTS